MILHRPTIGQLRYEEAVDERIATQLLAALDAAGIGPGEAFYVSRVPLAPDAPTPGASHRGDPSTSRKAALDNAPRSGTQRMAVLKTAVVAGEWGVTAESAARITGMRSTASGNSAAKRLSELKQGGYVEAVEGRTRPTASGSEAQVYVATEKGRAA